MALHDSISNSINYNDLNAGVIYPAIKVYVRLNPEFDDNIPGNLASYTDTDEWNAGTKRMEITDYVVNIGNVSFEGENEIFSDTTGNSSVTLDVIKEIPHTTRHFFNFNDDTNIFSLLQWSDKTYSIFHVEFSLLDDANGSVVSGKTTTLFQGKLTTLTSRDNTIQLKIDDGLIESTHKQSLIGKKIFDEVIKYEDRFFITEENKKSNLTASNVFGGWVLDSVKKTKEFNLVNAPIIKPERDSKNPIVRGYIKRFDKDRLDSAKQKNTSDGKFYWGDDFTEIDFSEKIGDDNELKFNRAEIDYENGILNFEVPPIRQPDGFLYIDHYKTPYRYKHPAFLAEKLFESLGYENVNFEKKKLNPYHPNPLNFNQDFKNKKINKYGQISPLKSGKNYGAKIIKYCEYDGLFYYFTKGGIYRTDLNELNEKIITTQLRIVDMELILMEDTTNFLRIVVTAKSYEEIKIGNSTLKTNNERFINPYCQKNTKGSETKPDFVWETLDPKLRKSNEKTQLPDRDLIQKPTTYFNEWLDDSTVTLHFYDYKNDDGFQNNIIWLEEDTVYESIFDPDGDTGSYNTPSKLFSFKYNEKVNGVITKYEDNGDEYVDIPCRIVVKKGVNGNIPQTGEESDKSPIYSLIASYKAFHWEYAPNEHQIKIIYDYATDQHQVEDKEVVDVIYKYNLDDNTGFGEGYTLVWKNGFPLEVYNHAITDRSDFEQDFAWTYWTTESLTPSWTGGDIVGSQSSADDLIEEKYLKKIRVLSLENEDDYLTEHFYEIITHNPINNIAPMSNKTPGSNSNGLFYIFGNELTNNILVSKIEEDPSGIKKTKLFFMGVDRHFHDYYQYAEELGGSDSNWGYNEFDDQYFCFVEFNIANTNLKEKFDYFKSADYKYTSGGSSPTDYSYRFDFTDPTNAIKWNMKGYNWRFPIHSTFIGADMILENESQDVNQLYILFNDKIIRFKHYMDGNDEESGFLANKDGTYPANSSETQYVPDRQFLACINDPIVNGEIITSKTETSDHFFAHIKYPSHSFVRPILLNYEYMLNNSILREWDAGNGFMPSFQNGNYRDIYRSKNFSSGIKNTPEELDDWDTTIYDRDAPFGGSDWNDKPTRPYMYAMNYCNELSHKTMGLRVHQVYGLSKLKRDESWSNLPDLQDMAKFSFIAVNRDYLVKNQIGSDCDNTKRWGLSGMAGSGLKPKYRMSFGEHDELYLPDTLLKPEIDKQETNVMSGISIMFFVDFSKENSIEDFEATSKKRGKLLAISSTLPSTLHEDYKEFLDPVTQEFDEMFLNKSNRGEFDSSVKFDEDSQSKINLAILKTVKTGYPLSNPSGGISGILGRGVTSSSVFQYANRQGGDWDLFPISGWLNDLLMGFDKIHTPLEEQYFSPYKSQYFPFSFKSSDAGTRMFHLSTQWMVNSRIGGKLIGKKAVGERLGWSAVQNNIEIGTTDNKFVASPNYLFSFFDHFLVSLRRDFTQRYIMNSLLPKCSKDVGDSIITEVGNWGEYLTTHNFSTLPDSFMDLNEFDSSSNDSIKYQNSHGTLLFLGSNHISDNSFNQSIKVHKTKHVHYINKDLVYKDFLSKPIICTIDGRTESHFSIGSSIGYKSLYKEAKFDDGIIPNMYKKRSILNRNYNISERTDALMSYRLFDQENMIWCSLEDFIEPRIPIFNSADQTVFQSLQQLGSLMDYKFGIKNGVPYFEDKENLFRVKYDTQILNDVSKQDYLKKNGQNFDDTGFKLASYYFILGEIIQIDATESVAGGEVVHRSVEYSKSKISDVNFIISSTVNIYGEDEDIVRISEIGTNHLDVNIYEIKSVINEKNLIEVSKYNRLYVNDYSDYEITYGDSNIYRRKLNNVENFKNTFTLDVPQINDFDWIEYLARKIERNVNKLRFNLNMSIKLNPNITNGDYIAMYEPIHKIGYELTTQSIPAVNPHTDGTNYKRYELFKVQSVTHNLENYTSSINCYSVDVNYSSITQG